NLTEAVKCIYPEPNSILRTGETFLVAWEVTDFDQALYSNITADLLCMDAFGEYANEWRSLSTLYTGTTLQYPLGQFTSTLPNCGPMAIAGAIQITASGAMGIQQDTACYFSIMSASRFSLPPVTTIPSPPPTPTPIDNSPTMPFIGPVPTEDRKMPTPTTTATSPRIIIFTGTTDPVLPTPIPTSDSPAPSSLPLPSPPPYASSSQGLIPPTNTDNTPQPSASSSPAPSSPSPPVAFAPNGFPPASPPPPPPPPPLPAGPPGGAGADATANEGANSSTSKNIVAAISSVGMAAAVAVMVMSLLVRRRRRKRQLEARSHRRRYGHGDDVEVDGDDGKNHQSGATRGILARSRSTSTAKFGAKKEAKKRTPGLWASHRGGSAGHFIQMQEEFSSDDDDDHHDSELDNRNERDSTPAPTTILIPESASSSPVPAPAPGSMPVLMPTPPTRAVLIDAPNTHHQHQNYRHQFRLSTPMSETLSSAYSMSSIRSSSTFEASSVVRQYWAASMAARASRHLEMDNSHHQNGDSYEQDSLFNDRDSESRLADILSNDDSISSRSHRRHGARNGTFSTQRLRDQSLERRKEMGLDRRNTISSSMDESMVMTMTTTMGSSCLGSETYSEAAYLAHMHHMQRMREQEYMAYHYHHHPYHPEDLQMYPVHPDFINSMTSRRSSSVPSLTSTNDPFKTFDSNEVLLDMDDPYNPFSDSRAVTPNSLL
ncbi:hypothetical protein BGZ94_003367, partial [Podila epigama]